MRTATLAMATLGVLMGSGVVCADDFRVESTVFANKDREPVSQSSTIFHAGVVYDYLSKPARTAVLDKARGRFILLDVARKEKAELQLTEVTQAVTTLRELAEKSPNAFLKFAARPDFSLSVDSETGALEFASPQMTYRVKGVTAETASLAHRYRDFLDWTAQLNAVLSPAAPPPFARMHVNSEVAARDLLPESVELVIPKQLALKGRGLTLRSEHLFTWRLLEKDLDDIATTGSQIANFKLVPLSVYRKNFEQ